MNIIVTKKLDSKNKQKLLDEKFDVFDANYIQIKLKKFTSNTTKDYLIFTSQNAVKSVLKNEIVSTLKQIKCFCIGEKTKIVLEENQFQVVNYFNYAEDLAKEIMGKYQQNSFLFFSGNLRRDTLPLALKKAKIDFEELEVYETILAPKKVEKLGYNAILFFSPSGVFSFLQENEIKNEMCFCIGTTTAKALENKTKYIQIAPKQTVDSVVETVLKYYNN